MFENLEKILEDFEAKAKKANEMHFDLQCMFESIGGLLKEFCSLNRKNNNSLSNKSINSHEIVKFNIGGTVFSTLMSTITKKILKPGTKSVKFFRKNMLEHLVSGKVPAPYDEQGCIFIDRSAKYFYYILDYLRMANTNEYLNLPRNKTFLKELLKEARFYQLDGFKEFIKKFNNQVLLDLKSKGENFHESKIEEKNAFVPETEELEETESKYENFNQISVTKQIDISNLVSENIKEIQKIEEVEDDFLNESDTDDGFKTIINHRQAMNCVSVETLVNASDSDRKLLQNEKYTNFKDCMIVFMESSQSFYVQQSNFDEEITKIQPDVDKCLNPYDSKESALCVGQFKSDDQFYRCRVLDWNEATNEAKCVFIDYGNTDMVSLDTITEMSETLKKVMPLAIHCKMEENFEIESKEFKRLTDLVLNDTLFDIRIKTADLMQFYSAENYDFGPITAELCISRSNI